MDQRPKRRAVLALSLAVLTLTASAGTPAFASDNPLDRVGIEHNVYLGCLMRDGGDPRESPLRRVVEECGFAPGTSTGEFVALYSSPIEADPNQPIAAQMLPYRALYTDDQFSYFHRIDRVVASAGSQATADAMFAQLEDEATARLTSGTPAEQSILAALSTARNSLQYWARTFESPKADGSPTGTPKRMNIIRKILIIAAFDIVGSSIGTLMEGPEAGAAAGAAFSRSAIRIVVNL